MSEHVIEFNGKRYDAVTGTYLGKSHVIPKHITDRIVHGKAIDGFVRQQPAKKTADPASQPKTTAKAKTAKAATPKNRVVVRSSANQARTQANHLKAHSPQHSKTLVRRHTRKPAFTMKPAIKPQAPAEMMATPPSAIARKQSAYSVNPSRRQRAVSTARHPAIQRFKTPAIHSVSAEVPVIPVSPAPLELVLQAAEPAALPAKHHNDIFANAIAKATSHEQPAHKVRRHRSGKRRLANSLAVVATFLVIGGFVTYLNLPGIQMQIASFQAGFGASLPTYAPTGYALEGGVKRSGNTISLSFRSGDQTYRITQQSSNWNSQTLLDSTLALGDGHQTIQKNGQTIYIYEDGGTNAAWVNGGVRYDLTGNAQLSKDEVASIAASL